jgi:hypothetical protein
MAVRRLLAGAGVVALGCAVCAAPIGMAAEPSTQTAKKKVFKPKKLAGQWEGAHTNTTFGTSGPASATVLAPGKKFGLQLDLGGNVFGCGDPPQGPVNLLKKGKGPNTWSDKGFRVDLDTPALGHVTMNYKFKTKAITGTGTAPPCLPNITYTFTGTLTTKTMDLDIEIDLGGGQTAHTDLVINKA